MRVAWLVLMFALGFLAPFGVAALIKAAGLS
jgi:hypothetical protein